MLLFLSPSKPIATCTRDSCNYCKTKESIHCHFSVRDLAKFLLIVAPSLAIGGYGIFRCGGWPLFPWLIMFISYFGFIEIRVLCSHCPHYAEKERSLKCWANFGSPKVWKFRPGPMTTLEKTIYLGGFVLLWGYPLFFIVYAFHVVLFAAYVPAATGFFMLLRKGFCKRCMNFACPLNHVKVEDRKEFLRNNPQIAKA
jgi:hypothetical protein